MKPIGWMLVGALIVIALFVILGPSTGKRPCPAECEKSGP